MKLKLFTLGAALLSVAPAFSSPNYLNDFYKADFQVRTITGKVTNSAGEPLEGVTVNAKGSTKSVTTDQNGQFTIGLEANTKTLIFSFVGQETQEMPVGNRTTIDVQLKAVDNSMEDVVVVGYGTQKKINLTGSVGSVSGKVLTQRPAPTVTNLLQGRITGLQVVQNSAEPGRDAGSILIRGKGSFGASITPLVLIDGVTGNMANLSPDDVENVTVLKDAASAAIYGSRAANGVILITTKKGKKGDPLISYSLNMARQSPTSLPHFITNSAEYMTLYNTAAANNRASGTPIQFTPAQINSYKNATDRNQYPNFDPVNYWLKPALSQDQTLSISGGNDRSTYNFSTSYLNQDAFVPKDNYKRYNALLNYSTHVNKVVTIGTSINLTYKDHFEPPFTGSNLMIAIFAVPPYYGPYLLDGSGRVVANAYSNHQGNRNPSEYYAAGWQDTKEYNMNGQAYMDINLFKGMVLSSKVAINYVDEYYKMYQHQINTYFLQERDPVTGDYKAATLGPTVFPGGYQVDRQGVTEQYAKTLQPSAYTTLNYNTEIGNGHNIKALAGFEQLSNKVQSLRGTRLNGVSQALTDLGGYSTTAEAVNQSFVRIPGQPAAGEWGLRSFFGRLNYDYQGKYLFEADIRYDGTSKVSPEYRWGTFPSISAGWVASKEKFLENRFSWLSTLKLRGSWGVLGNQDIGNYAWEDVLSVTSIYPFGNSAPLTGATLNGFKDRSIRWESTRILDGGFDMDIKNGLLGITFDWFDKYTYNILAQPTIPLSIGLSKPTINNGAMRNRGIELELTHENHIGEFTYGLNVQFSTYRNELVSILVPDISSVNIKKVGLPYNSFYMYQFDGIVQQGETPLPHSLVQTGLNPGDIKMKDISGPNGKPDGKITPDDRAVVKGAYPNYFYSFGGHVDYKNLSLSFFFQGVQGIKERVANWGIDPFDQGGAPTVEWENAWTPQNKSNTMPGIYISGYNNIAQYANNSTYNLRNASYLRLKNLMLSYSFSKSVYSKIMSKGLSVFISTDNLVTFTKFKNGDPERPNYSSDSSPDANFNQFPQARILNAGLNVKF